MQECRAVINYVHLMIYMAILRGIQSSGR